MSVETALRFRDPFSSQSVSPRQHSHISTSSAWSSYRGHPDLNRALTPPHEMNSVLHDPHKSTAFPREHANHYGGYMSAQRPSRAAVAPYLPQILTSHGSACSRTHSPDHLSRPRSTDFASSRSRKSSQSNAIAPSFQIPRSINDSGGSLSELAAQMTCLFWFESSEILQQIEDRSGPLYPSRPLVPDARPTTGFHKWVTTILSTTCVAQNVVLLALLFIHRLKKLNPTVRGKPGSEYRLLTVALMLGNKFLDDNTYTNKTWAEVSGINVGEVHIMEVEFLSNMKYCLFTSAEDWSNWQSLLGKFAAFFDRANRPMAPATTPALPPPSSLQLPVALPSPPPSNQASPPFVPDLPPNGIFNGNKGPTPAPSPLSTNAPSSILPPSGRKRSRDDHTGEPPAKRIVSEYVNHPAPNLFPTTSAASGQPLPRITLPSLPMTNTQLGNGNYAAPGSAAQQLPSLAAPTRAMAMVYPSSNTPTQTSAVGELPGPSSHVQPTPRMVAQYPSGPTTAHSHTKSASATPLSSLPPSSIPVLQPPSATQKLSPTHLYLQQRNSPYRPVHNVSTLTHPPTAAGTVTQYRPQPLDHEQMAYQPLGKPFQQPQNGRLPYVSQNVWLDPHGSGAQAMTPIHQWPSFQAPPAHSAAQR